jgi:hypothetical protein
VPRTLHLHWPTLHDDRAAAQLRNAAHALGRISPLVASGARQIEIGIDGLQVRNGDESAVASAALRAVATHIRTAPRAAIASSRLAAAVAATVGEVGTAGVADDAACTILPPGSEADFLAPQRVEALRFAAPGRSSEELAEAIERCSLLGVRTLGALARLRSGELGARLGAIAGLLIPLARGEDVQAIPPVPLPRRLVARESFDLPLTSIEEFRFPLRRALDDLLARVRRDLALDPAILLHHRRERLGHGAQANLIASPSAREKWVHETGSPIPPPAGKANNLSRAPALTLSVSRGKGCGRAPGGVLRQSRRPSGRRVPRGPCA